MSMYSEFDVYGAYDLYYELQSESLEAEHMTKERLEPSIELEPQQFNGGKKDQVSQYAAYGGQYSGGGAHRDGMGFYPATEDNNIVYKQRGEKIPFAEFEQFDDREFYEDLGGRNIDNTGYDYGDLIEESDTEEVQQDEKKAQYTVGEIQKLKGGGGTESLYKRLLNHLEAGEFSADQAGTKNIEGVADTVRRLSNNFNTLDNRFTQLRKVFKMKYGEYYPNSVINKVFSLTGEERGDKIQSQHTSRVDQLEHRYVIPQGWILDLVNTLKASNDFKDRVLLLILATGRRLIDVLRITSLPTKQGRIYGSASIYIDRVSKSTRDGFTVPLMFISYDEMKERWEAVREALKGDSALSNVKLSDKYIQPINRRVRDMNFEQFGGKDERIGSHMLRKVWVASAMKKYKPPSIDSTVFIGRLLGHSSKTLDTSLNYKNVTITPGTAAPGVKAALSKPPNETLIRMIEAVKKLKAEGKNPSARAVKVFGFGSKSIDKYLKEAKEAAGI